MDPQSAEDIPVLRMNHEFAEATVIARPSFSGISSEARNLAPNNKVSLSPSLTSFEPSSFKMTKVDLSWRSPRFSKALTNYMMQTAFRRKFREAG